MQSLELLPVEIMRARIDQKIDQLLRTPFFSRLEYNFLVKQKERERKLSTVTYPKEGVNAMEW